MSSISARNVAALSRLMPPYFGDTSHPPLVAAYAIDGPVKNVANGEKSCVTNATMTTPPRYLFLLLSEIKQIHTYYRERTSKDEVADSTTSKVVDEATSFDVFVDVSVAETGF